MPCYHLYFLCLSCCRFHIWTNSNQKAFTGISELNARSVLQFFDIILFGEEKEEIHKWIGIEGVNDILTGLNIEIADIKNANLEDELDIHMETINEQRDIFLPKLKSVHKHFYKDGDDSSIGNVKEGYYIEYTMRIINI